MNKQFLSACLLLIGLFFTIQINTYAIESTPTLDTQLSTPTGQPAPQPVMSTPPPPALNVGSYLLIDANSGTVLASNKAEARMPPASLTKMMTMYLISDALKRGQIHLSDQVPISEKAWRMEGSRMFTKVGDKIPLVDLIRGIVITSGNDSCVAMAEYMAGSEESFANLMNQQAKLLGMKNSHFTDSTGLSDPNHYTTAMDMSILARALIRDFPEYYSWYKEKQYKFNNIEQYNRNTLLWSDSSVDGIKTGHTDEAGYCLVASAKRGNMRLISVVMNSPSVKQRGEDTQRLLTYGFRFFKTYPLYKAGETLATVRVWKGKQKQIPVGVKQDLSITIPVNQYNNLKPAMELTNRIEAPIQKGQVLGNVKVKLQQDVVTQIPLIALEANPQAGLWGRMTDSIRLSINHWLGKAEDITMKTIKENT